MLIVFNVNCKLVYSIKKMANDLMTDIGFGMTIIGLLVIILSGIILPQSREKTFNHMIIIGSVIAVLGGIIIIARIPY